MSTNLCSRSRTKYMTVKEFGEKYSLSKAHINNLIKDGLPNKRFGKCSIRIPEEEAIDFINKKYNY